MKKLLPILALSLTLWRSNAQTTNAPGVLSVSGGGPVVVPMFLVATTNNTNTVTLSTNAALNFGVVSNGQSKSLTFPLLTVGTNGDWSLTPPTPDIVSIGTVTNVSFAAWVSATNTVTVQANNNGTNTQTLGNGHFRVTAFKWVK